VQWNSHTSVRRATVTVRALDRAQVIEVDGDLDVIGGHDLRQAFSAALRTSTGDVALDLSSVTAVDDLGAASLEWCSAQAIEARRILTWTACSQPLVRDLRARSASPSRHPGSDERHRQADQDRQRHVERRRERPAVRLVRSPDLEV